MVPVFIIAHTIIIAAVLWAIFSPRINDGLLGKLSLALMCFSSVACVGWAVEVPGTVDQSDVMFSVAVAIMAVRCFWLKTCAVKTRQIIRKLRK